MKRRFLSVVALVILILSMMQLIGCALGSPPPEPIRALFTKEVDDALRSTRLKAPSDPDKEEMRYEVVVDSRLASNFGTNGYVQKGCTTLQNIFSCCRNMISTEKYSGYYTCDPYEVCQIDPITQENMPIGSSVCKETASVFSIAANGHCPGTHTMPAQAIAQIAESADESSVHIFITDLAMPQPSDAYMIVDALTDWIIPNNSLTMGLIGVQADFAGIVRDIPVTYVGVQLPERSNYQKPIYLLFIGEKKAVFSSMDHFLRECENNDGLSADGQVNAMYYYKYDRKCTLPASVLSSKQQDVSVAYTELLPEYMLEQYNTTYVFSDIPEDPETKEFVTAMPFAKVYSGILADARIWDETDNVTFSFPIPYEIVCETGNAKSKLLKPGQSLEFSDGTLTLTSELQRLRYILSGEALHLEGWSAANGDGLTLSSNTALFDLGRERGRKAVTVAGRIDVTQFELDNPAIFKAEFDVSYIPSDEELSRDYDTAWLHDWQMDIDTLQKEWGREACFREAVKSPHLAEVFDEMLLGAHLAAVKSNLSENDTAFEQSAMFGLILREQALYYDNSTDWDDAEGFDWAFSKNEIIALAAANAK